MYWHLITVTYNCYNHTDEDYVWTATYKKSEKEMCERHKGYLFSNPNSQRKNICGRDCKCCGPSKGAYCYTTYFFVTE